MNQPPTSRMAELASELIGAKAASEFLKEAWASASPEAKKEIADALVRRVVKDIDSFGCHATVLDIVEPVLRAELEKFDVVGRVREEIASRGEAFLKKIVDDSIGTALGTIGVKIVDVFNKHVRKLSDESQWYELGGHR